MGLLQRIETPWSWTARPRPAAGPASAVARARAVPLAVAAVLATGALPTVPDKLGAQQADAREAYLRAAAEHFDFGSGEVVVLSRWGLSAGEISVVFFLAVQARVAPDVVVAQRRQGGSWMEIAAGYSVHAGNFHVPLAEAPPSLAPAYERFGAVEASQWSTVPLSDAEVVALVNVRFLSRYLSVSPDRAAQELDGGDVVEGYRRLRSGGR